MVCVYFSPCGFLAHADVFDAYAIVPSSRKKKHKASRANIHSVKTNLNVLIEDAVSSYYYPSRSTRANHGVYSGSIRYHLMCHPIWHVLQHHHVIHPDISVQCAVFKAITNAFDVVWNIARSNVWEHIRKLGKKLYFHDQKMIANCCGDQMLKVDRIVQRRHTRGKTFYPIPYIRRPLYPCTLPMCSIRLQRKCFMYIIKRPLCKYAKGSWVNREKRKASLRSVQQKVKERRVLNFLYRFSRG